MRKSILFLSVLLLTSCSWFNSDLWSLFESLPLTVETLENPENQWVYDYQPLSDETYLITKISEDGYYAERRSKDDDSILSTLPLSPYILVGATLANGSLYLLMYDFETYPSVEHPFKIVQMDSEAVNVEKEILIDLEYSPYMSLFFANDDASVFIVSKTSNTVVIEYDFNLGFVSTYNILFEEDEDATGKIGSLSSEKSSLLTENGFYFVFDQVLFHKVGQNVVSLPYQGVTAIISYINQKLMFIQYDYCDLKDEEYLHVDRVSLGSDDQENTRERLLTIEESYLEVSHNKNNAFFTSFTFFDDSLFFIGGRNERAAISSLLDYGILRLDLMNSTATTYFKSDEHASDQSTFYYNGHFAYFSEANDLNVLRQINFHVVES